MQVWLLGAYLDLAGLRVVTALLLRDSVIGREKCILCYFVILLGGLLPFLLAWTVLGTVWYVEAVHEDCVTATQLPDEEKPWLFVLLLAVDYSILTLFSLVLITTCVRIAHITRQHAEISQSLVLVSDNLDPERPLEPQEMTQLERHMRKFKPGKDTSTCTICCEDFTVSFTQAREKVLKLPGCGHCFHSNCAKDWLKIKAQCPYCKGEIRLAIN